MFTVKVYDYEDQSCQLYQAEGVRRQFLGNNTSEIAIQKEIGNASTWLFLRLRPLGWKDQTTAPVPEAEWGKYYSEVIVENAAGKTTEIYKP